MAYSVAIDGPAGAGKSTIAKLISKEMGYIYVDTGAMYRAMAVYFTKNNIDPDDENAINAAVDNVDISIEYQNGEQQVILNGENVTGLLRTEETGNMASRTSKYKEVRSKLVELQRQLAKTSDVVMDGRDIGTTVLPDAFVKIYLTASSDARAKRRYDELTAKGEQCDINDIKEDIEKPIVKLFIYIKKILKITPIIDIPSIQDNIISIIPSIKLFLKELRLLILLVLILAIKVLISLITSDLSFSFRTIKKRDPDIIPSTTIKITNKFNFLLGKIRASPLFNFLFISYHQ